MSFHDQWCSEEVEGADCPGQQSGAVAKMGVITAKIRVKREASGIS